MGALPVGLFVIWAVHNGGYDTDTWYWGALLVLATLGVVLALGVARPRLSKAAIVALCAFALYVAWSYLSITWAQSSGDALQGSNRALLYLLVFALMLSIPWTVEAAFGLLLVFVLAVGVIAVVLLVRFASMDHVGALVIEGRLSAPTGYFNATAALFTMQALTAIVLSTRRELPFVVRGALLATACAGLELAVAVQSRGWLLTLPLIAIVGIAIVPDRLRVVAAAILPILGTLFPLRTLLHLYTSANAAELSHTAGTAGKRGLVSCAVVLVVGSLVAWLDQRTHAAALGRGARRAIGATVAVAAVALGFAGAMVATHGHLFRFISRQWNGFSHETTSDTATHFAAVGSGRYDFWRVALDAFLAHPVGGLGQDNFADYYILHRHTGEDPAWTHSLEFRLLAHTGAVGFVLFAVFVIAALTAAIQARRHGRGLAAAVTGAAMLPFIVWLIHGSVDWFWEVPALSGPALGFLAMSGTLRETQPRDRRGTGASTAMARGAVCGGGGGGSRGDGRARVPLPGRARDIDRQQSQRQRSGGGSQSPQDRLAAEPAGGRSRPAGGHDRASERLLRRGSADLPAGHLARAWGLVWLVRRRARGVIAGRQERRRALPPRCPGDQLP